jgi:hypothetical protein
VLLPAQVFYFNGQALYNNKSFLPFLNNYFHFQRAISLSLILAEKYINSFARIEKVECQPTVKVIMLCV